MQAQWTVPDLMTRHGRQRMHARRIPEEGIQATLDWGREWHGSDACEFVRLDRRAVAQAKRWGQDLCQFEGITLIRALDGTILTVFRNREGFRVRR